MNGEPRRITDEFNLLDVTANAGRFILLGEAHGKNHEVTAMIPTLARSRVTVLGMELPVDMNRDLNNIQHAIRQGVPPATAAAMLADAFTRRGTPQDYDKINANTALITEATRHGMRVAAIDARDWSPASIEHRARLDQREQDVARTSPDDHAALNAIRREQARNTFEKDVETAANARAELQKEAPESRMAIAYGSLHTSPGRDHAQLAAGFTTLREALASGHPVTDILTSEAALEINGMELTASRNRLDPSFPTITR